MQVGQLCLRYSDNALLVTDSWLTSATPHVRDVADHMRAVGIRTHVLPLSSPQMGILESARVICERMHITGSDLCVAVGGGSVMDAGKLARAAHHEPWLLDRAIWQRPAGVVTNLSRHPRGPPYLVALPTRPGTAAEVAPQVALAPDTGASRRLLTGGSLRPTVALIDPDCSSTLSRAAWFESFNEILFRVLGPFLVTQRNSRSIDRATARWISEIIGISTRIEGRKYPNNEQRLRLAELSVATATARHVHYWSPTLPAWWCIQNTVSAETGRSKGDLTSQALPFLLHKIAGGDERLGSSDRLRRLERYTSYGRRIRTVIDDLSVTTQDVLAPRHKLQRDEEVVRWAREIKRLWGQHPGIAALGIDGTRSLLQDMGF